MVEKKTKTEAAAPKAAKKPAAPKAVAPKAEAKKEAPAKVAKSASGKTVTVTQTGSAIGRQGYQRATLIGLGLNKLNRTRTLEDTASVRGMIAKVKHLVKIVDAK